MECGQNPSHPTEKCFKLKNAKNKAQGTSTLTKGNFRKEINSLSRKRPKAEVLEMFTLVLQAEHSKLAKTKKSSKAEKAPPKRSILDLAASSDSSDSDTPSDSGR